MTKYLLNGWGWSMPQPKKGSLDYEDLSEDEFDREVIGAVSCIGNPILARVLNVPFNPGYIDLKPGDIAIVINLKGGRLHVGDKEFPKDVTVKYTKVELKEATA